MNRDTFHGTKLHARTSLLADDLADRIALAGHPAEIDEVVKEVWGHHFAGALTEDEAEVLDDAARARREAIQERRTETRQNHEQPLPAHHGPPHEGLSGRPTVRPASRGAVASSHPARYRRPWPPDSRGASKP
jgi:hypothetical protein